MATVREVQQRLLSLGYDVGPSGGYGIPARRRRPHGRTMVRHSLIRSLAPVPT
ncbi:hypothetical protein J2766_003393 [Agrobacterium tumefaciens]|uniref:Uncharacterized protein n=1 Tax=Agrobacterium tumefaciens TaxID=358 RepID=A0AAW8LKZ6_AGRTU|nr:hypothetical protein [Agrobacterium tumefaciens]MDR6700745.1 hypothetical protein [Agrobacterium tumefaciens]